MAKASRSAGKKGMRPGVVRRLHHYVGLFIAPSVLFFAVSGGFQLFSLHEAHGAYKPPALVVAMAGVHKDQVLARKREPDEAPAGERHAKGPRRPESDREPPRPRMSTLALKWFFLLVDAGLIASTLLGLWMALTMGRDRRAAWLVLLAGAAAPLALLFI